MISNFSKVSITIGLTLALIFGIISIPRAKRERVEFQRVSIGYNVQSSGRFISETSLIAEDIYVERVDDKTIIVHAWNNGVVKKYQYSYAKNVSYIVEQKYKRVKVKSQDELEAEIEATLLKYEVEIAKQEALLAQAREARNIEVGN